MRAVYRRDLRSVVWLLLFVLCLTDSARAELQQYGCFDGEYIISRSVVRAKNHKALDELNELSSESLSAHEELNNGILVTEGTPGMRTMRETDPDKKEVNAEDELCNDLQKEQRRRRLAARGRIQLSSGERPRQIVRRFDCSCNAVLRVSAGPDPVKPDDSKFPLLWGLDQSNDIDMDAPEAWSTVTDADSVVVAVIDTGVDYNHEDLKANMWVNPFEIPGNGIDDEGNGYVDDIYGINAITKSGNPMDDHGHGTHCAGTIGGVGDNGKGVTGVVWKTHIMGIKFLSASGSGSLWDAMRGLEYVLDMRKRGVALRVTSNSWGGGGYFDGMRNLIIGHMREDILFVAAAGNSKSNNDVTPAYPASYDVPNVISVAAVDSAGKLASFSSYGKNTVHVGAPGVSIASTYLGNKYTYFSGTSMATPHVSGALTMLLGYNWNLEGLEAKQLMMDTGDNLSSLSSITITGKMPNLRRMLEAAPLPPGGTPPGPNPSPSPSASPSMAPSQSPSPSPSMIPVPGKWTLSGTVTGTSQVRVEFKNGSIEKTMFTGADGSYAIRDVDTPPHAFTLIASKEGYHTQTFSGFLSGSDQVINISMQPKRFVVSGLVLDSTGTKPWGQYSAFLFVNGKFRESVVIDASGRYSFGLDYGETYEIQWGSSVKHRGVVLGDVSHLWVDRPVE